MKLEDNHPVKILYMKYKEKEIEKDKPILEGFVEELKKQGYKIPERTH